MQFKCKDSLEQPWKRKQQEKMQQLFTSLFASNFAASTSVGYMLGPLHWSVHLFTKLTDIFKHESISWPSQPKQQRKCSKRNSVVNHALPRIFQPDCAQAKRIMQVRLQILETKMVIKQMPSALAMPNTASSKKGNNFSWWNGNGCKKDNELSPNTSKHQTLLQ